jgi:hypothetical protein
MPTGRSLHPLIERGIVHRRKIVNAAIAHKRFEADHAACRQFIQLSEILRDQSAPEREINQRGYLGCLLFEGKTGGIQGWRRGVEGHFGEAGGATGGEGARASGESLPFGATGLVEMDVGIDHAGENV